MPDQYGFNYLGTERACIDCNVRGSAGEWPEHRRRQHHAAHVKEKRKQVERAARQRARDALRLKKQLDKENALAYKKEGR